jgi:hypothetical protein
VSLLKRELKFKQYLGKMDFQALGFKCKKSLHFAELWHNEEKEVLMIEFFPYTEIGVEEAKIAEKSLLAFTKDSKKLLGITKLNEGTDMNHEAREHFANCRLTKEHTLALAAVFDNLGHRILYNFYLKVNKPGIPMKGFNKVENAIEWLINKRDSGSLQ